MKMNVLSFIVLLILSVSFSLQKVNAQGEANIWYFGINAGVDFKSGTPVALTDGALVTSEGCATISDKNGNLIFYTDGRFVWNKNHQQMLNGFGLMGHSSAAQSAIIVPKPGDDYIFFVFTVDYDGNPGGFRYSVVDMTLNNGLGDVVVASKNTLLFTPAVEKVASVKHSNGLYVWVIAHGLSNNRYYAYLVDCTGVNAPVISDVGQIEGPPGWGCLTASPNGLKLASAMRSPGFEVLDFDPSTGIISNPILLASTGNAYGVTFSPDNNLLYGLDIVNHQIYQWNLQAGTPADVVASIVNLGTAPGTGTPYRGGTMQIGPDGKIYIPHFQQPFLAAINNPNAIGPASNLQFNAVDLQGRNAILGLPPFIQSFFDTIATISFTGTCIGDSTIFTISSITTFLDSVRWHFDDPASGAQNTSSLLQPVHQFSSPGTYQVELIRYIDCIVDTTIQEIIVTPVPVHNQDFQICSGDSIILPGGSVANQSGIYTDTINAINGCDSVVITQLTVNPVYEIELHDTICNGETYVLPDGLTVTTAGTYTNSFTSSQNCDSTMIIHLIVHPVYQDSVDVVICDNESYTLPDGIIVNTSGQYTSNLSSINSCDSIIHTNLTVLPTFLETQADTICSGENYMLPDGSSVSESGVYESILSSQAGCDSVVVIDLFVIDLNASIEKADVLCNGDANGTLSVIVSGDYPPILYEWSTLETDTSIQNLGPGNYSLTVTDNYGCEIILSETINEPAPLDVIISEENISCYGNADGKINIMVSGGTPDYTYFIDNEVAGSGIQNLAGGEYTIDVTDANACSYSLQVTIYEPDPVLVSTSPSPVEYELGDTVQLIVTSNYDPESTYHWEYSPSVSCFDCYNPVIYYFVPDTLKGHVQYPSPFNPDIVCIQSVFIPIDVDIRTNLYIPNAFSPNADETNDIYQIFGSLKALRTFQFYIFNRWGGLVFETDQTDFEWDGRFNGTLLPNGVYTYLAVYSFWGAEQSVTKRKGSITLVR